jgi:hypothetical protein
VGKLHDNVVSEFKKTRAKSVLMYKSEQENGLVVIRTRDLRRVKAEFENPVQNAVSSNGVTLQFTREELQHYTASRTKGLSDKSIRWLQKSRDILWEKTNGELSASTLSALRESVLDLFGSRDSWSKVLGFTVAFLKYLSKVNFDQRYRHLEVHLELPKAIRAVKLLTSRIITTEDIQNTIKAIDSADDLSSEKKLNYKGMVMFLAYSGQRVLTGAQITVSQFKEALRHAPPVLTVEAHQDKIRLQHYVPIHPAVIPVLQEVIEGKQEDEVAFDYNGLMRWLKENPVPLARINGKIELKDLRKAFEQISDEIGFTDANKNFIMSHGVSSINWQSYKQFLPENVYKRYMECWGKVSF